MTPQEYLLERSGVVDAKTRAAIREACTAWDEERIALVEALASVPKRIRELEAELTQAKSRVRLLEKDIETKDETLDAYLSGIRKAEARVLKLEARLEAAEAIIAALLALHIAHHNQPTHTRARAFLEGKE